MKYFIRLTTQTTITNGHITQLTQTITKGNNMAKCTDCGTEQDGTIVHSGVDAFLLECIDLVGRICYDCANHRKALLKA
jgi:hypothetical protein